MFSTLPKKFSTPAEQSGLPKDTPILLGFSGGPDSMALLHMLYDYANTERSLLSEVRTMLNQLTVGSAFDSARYNALFTTLRDRNTPVIDSSHPLLLTAEKAVSIGVENSSTTIDMLRPVVWFEVRVYNHSDYPMLIDDISFSNFNPSTSYILPKDGTIPTSATYRSLPLYDTYTGGADITVDAATESCVSTPRTALCLKTAVWVVTL